MRPRPRWSASTLLVVATFLAPEASRPSGGAIGPSELFGVAVGPYANEAARQGFPFPASFAEIRALGATAVLIPFTLDQPDVRSSGVMARGAETEVLIVLTREAREAGLAVVWMPVLELEHGGPTDWRGRIAPTDRSAWWTAYADAIVARATLAEQLGVRLFAIGSELTSMSTDDDGNEWRRLATRARTVFSGRLAYVANHDALDQLAAFGGVDVAGVSAYFPLASSPDAPADELARAWRGHAAALGTLAADTGLPVYAFEVGYPSLDGGAVRPWDYTRGTAVDLEEQRAAYAAAAAALAEEPSVHGVFFWIWFGPGGPFDRYYTPRGKPAQQVMESFFQRVALRPRAGRSTLSSTYLSCYRAATMRGATPADRAAAR